MQKYSTPAIVPGGGKDALSIETLPDTLFGSVDVYLASEVDARIAELERIGAEYIARTDPLLDQLEPLSNRIAELENALREAKRSHSGCDDPWYNCPMHPDGCADSSLEKDECTCGAEEHNAKIDRALMER